MRGYGQGKGARDGQGKDAWDGQGKDAQGSSGQAPGHAQKSWALKGPLTLRV